MLDPIIAGLFSVLVWPAVGFLAGGILIGLVLGIIPGLSGLTGMAILLPFTYGLEPASAIAFLLGMFAVTTTSDTISCVLLGVPGTSASTATVIDGFPMARKGQASRAFGAAFTASAIGGLAGAIIAGVSLPIAQPLIVLFTSPEIFLLGVLGLTIVGSLSGTSIAKGTLAALIGLWIGTIGYSPSGAVPRFWLGIDYLLDGVPLVPFVLGLFALPELLDLTLRGSSISRIARADVKHQMLDGVRDTLRNWWLVARSAVIGVYIGIIPGLGGGIADWVAYGHAVQSSKDKSGYGKGDVRGVIAPETANNAMKGGALIPTIAFGIPGNAAMAILLGALLIHGMQPGPTLLGERLDVTFSMIWTLAIANVAGALLLMAGARWAAMLTFVRGELIVASVAVFVFMGAWMSSSDMGDWMVVLLFGVIGYAMKVADFPRAPMILGFVLGPIMENALFITTMSHDALEWLLRPTAVALELVFATVIGLNVWRTLRRRRLPGRPTGPRPAARAATLIAALLAVGFSLSLVEASEWSRDVGLMPIVVSAVALTLAVIVLSGEGRRWLGARRSVTPSDDTSSSKNEPLRAVGFFLWMSLVPALTLLVGQLIALPAFVAAYLAVRRTSPWLTIVCYVVGTWLFLFFLFGKAVHVIWYPGWLLRGG
jgi:TctA family transporter